MNTFITICGWLALLVILLGLCGLTIAAAFAGYKAVAHWFYCKAYNAARDDIARHIRTSAHWFSEDVGAWKCLAILANRMVVDMASYSYPEEWRGEWRKAVKKWNDEHPRRGSAVE
jgi:hypothetical protein